MIDDEIVPHNKRLCGTDMDAVERKGNGEVVRDKEKGHSLDIMLADTIAVSRLPTYES